MLQLVMFTRAVLKTSVAQPHDHIIAVFLVILVSEGGALRACVGAMCSYVQGQIFN